VGQIRPFAPEKLVAGILISRPELRKSLLEELRRHFGEVDYTSGDLPFGYTGYYDREMGVPITRFFVSFAPLVDPSALAQIKTRTNLLEGDFAEAGSRRVNIDPGLLSYSRFLLASSKDGSHRIPLRDGIYGEVTLVYERNAYRPLEWTYPDYRSPEYLRILVEVRRLYKRQLSGPKKTLRSATGPRLR
jgi:hypothetical protein